VEYLGVSEDRKNMMGMETKEGIDRIQQHGEELIDVCFMEMAERGNCH
jgi:hypothetical protein